MLLTGIKQALLDRLLGRPRATVGGHAPTDALQAVLAEAAGRASDQRTKAWRLEIERRVGELFLDGARVDGGAMDLGLQTWPHLAYQLAGRGALPTEAGWQHLVERASQHADYHRHISLLTWELQAKAPGIGTYRDQSGAGALFAID